MNKLLQDLKDYGGTIIVILLAILGAAITYGGTQAVAAVTIANHEARITTLELQTRKNENDIAVMKQHIDDLWHDAGHGQSHE